MLCYCCLFGFLLLFCDPDLLGIECSADGLHGALDGADTAADAFSLVDSMHLFILTCYSIHRTGLGADLTADAIVQHECLCPWIYEISYCIRWTFGDAEPADLAFVHVDPRQIFIDFRGIERADFHAHTAGYAPDLAGFTDIGPLVP